MSLAPCPLQVQSFDHITLIVKDLNATRNFYVAWLGMSECRRPGFDFPGAWFEIGTTQIHATVSDEMAGLAGWGDRNVKSISRGHHFAFQVPDVSAAHASALALGIEIASGPKIRPDGAKQLYLFDPDRHVVELCSRCV